MMNLALPSFRSDRRRSRGRAALLALAVGVLGAGCQIIPEPVADQTRYYALTGALTASAGESDPSGGVTLGLRAVELASYLDSRSLVVRLGPNEVSYEDYALWAEPLEEGVARLLRAQLLTSPRVGRVQSYPLPFSEPRDFEVVVRILRCEGIRQDGTAAARFAAEVEIFATEDGRMLARTFFAPADAPWDGRDHGQLVAALSVAANQLAGQVVAALPESP